MLYRRVSWHQIGGRDACPPGQVAKLSKNAFSDYPAEKAHDYGFAGPCMSVGISTVLEKLGLGPEAMLLGLSDFGVVGFTAGSVRELRRKNGDPCPQGVMPGPTEAEPWHAVVFGPEGRQRSNAEKQAIADVAHWVIPLVNDAS